MYRSALVSTLMAAAVLLTACGDDGSGSSADDRPSASTTSAAPATTQPAAPDAPGTDDEAPDRPGAGASGGAGGAGDGPGGGGTPAAGDPGPAAPAPGEAGTPAGSEQPGGFPREVLPTQGARLWAVYLAVGSPVDEWQAHKLGETEAYARYLGYTGSGIGSVACDQGAAEALGFAPDDNRVAVYFATAEAAQGFVAVYDRQDVGSAQVTITCR